MIPDWIAIFPNLPVAPPGNTPAQLELTRDHRLGKITLANKVRNNVNVLNRFGIKQKERIAQARLLFPKGAANFGENFTMPDLRNLCARWRAGIGIHRRTMA